MIWLLTGIPGSGKSYFAVSMINDLIEKLSKKKSISYEEASSQIKLLHNVDGLKIGTTIDSICAERDLDPLTLFSNKYHVENDEFRGWYFVVDECQQYFPKNYRNEDVQRFFQMHRHYGIDVVLLSQDYKLVCPAISLLSEYQFRAVSDTANPLPGFFMYRQMVGWEQIGRKFKRKKQKVFDLYKTADFDQKKVKRKARPMMIVFIICGILAVLAVWKISGFKNRGFNNSKIKQETPKTFAEKKAISQNRSPHQSFGQPLYDLQQYPESYLKKLNQNTLLTLDIIEDETGTHYLFMGTMWPSKDFPYEIVKTRIGLQAMVPLDLKLYIENQKTLLSDTTQNNATQSNQYETDTTGNSKKR